MLQATGASDLAILEALELAAAEIETRGFDRYVEISFEPTPGTDDTARATFDAELFWNDLAAAANERLLGLVHG